MQSPAELFFSKCKNTINFEHLALINVAFLQKDIDNQGALFIIVDFKLSKELFTYLTLLGYQIELWGGRSGQDRNTINQTRIQAFTSWPCINNGYIATNAKLNGSWNN